MEQSYLFAFVISQNGRIIYFYPLNFTLYCASKADFSWYALDY